MDQGALALSQGLAVNSVRTAADAGEPISASNEKAVKDAKEEIARFVKDFYPDEEKIKEALGENK